MQIAHSLHIAQASTGVGTSYRLGALSQSFTLTVLSDVRRIRKATTPLAASELTFRSHGTKMFKPPYKSLNTQMTKCVLLTIGLNRSDSSCLSSGAYSGAYITGAPALWGLPPPAPSPRGFAV